VAWKAEVADKAVVRIFGVIRDITREKEADHEIAQKDLELISQSRLAAVGELAAGVAHEINNPMAILAGCVQILEERVPNNQMPEEKLKEFLSKMSRSVTRVSTITAKLLKFAKNDDPLEYASIDINEVVSDVYELCSKEFEQHDIIVNFQTPDEPTMILGRSTEIGQVLLNITKNAKDALIEGEVPKPTIEMSINQNDQGVITVTVKNNGPKIPPDVVGKIFNPFFTTKEIGKGTGLGLSVSYSIMKEHHGKIFVDQTTEQTTFVLEFPPPEVVRERLAS
jgi:C4-dicarboxylate-specific signal transduction histidine kinase